MKKKNAGPICELEALRGFAAVYVFLHHAAPASGTRFAWLFSFGQEAVILFFLLSGFVICLSTRGMPDPVGRYLVHRARRIYPIALIAMAASWALTSASAGAWLDAQWGTLAMNVLMLQDVPDLKRGVWAATYFENAPLWSLSYEWWFYVLFVPLALWCGRVHGRALGWAFALSAIGAITFQLHPNQASLIAGYLMIWWTGVELAREYMVTGAVSVRGQRTTLAAVCVMILLWALPVMLRVAHHQPTRLGVDPVLQLRHHVAALAFVAVGAAWRSVGLRGFRWVFGWFAVLSPISYSLYLLHFPVLRTAGELAPHAPAFTRAAVAFALLVPVCYLLEVKLQRWINQATDAWLAPKPRASDPLVRP